MQAKAVFLDKDGTLIKNVPYNVDPDRIELMPGAREAAHSLHTAGYKLIVISNQSGVARGYFEECALGAVEDRLRELLAPVPLMGFYYCPHHPEGRVAPYTQSCDCRKPEPGLILRAAKKHDIDLAQSWFIGDILNDIETGHRAGCKAVLVDNGHETEWLSSPARRPDWTVPDLLQAANVITSSTPIKYCRYHAHD